MDLVRVGQVVRGIDSLRAGTFVASNFSGKALAGVIVQSVTGVARPDFLILLPGHPDLNEGLPGVISGHLFHDEPFFVFEGATVVPNVSSLHMGTASENAGALVVHENTYLVLGIVTHGMMAFDLSTGDKASFNDSSPVPKFTKWHVVRRGRDGQDEVIRTIDWSAVAGAISV